MHLYKICASVSEFHKLVTQGKLFVYASLKKNVCFGLSHPQMSVSLCPYL